MIGAPKSRNSFAPDWKWVAFAAAVLALVLLVLRLSGAGKAPAPQAVAVPLPARSDAGPMATLGATAPSSAPFVFRGPLPPAPARGLVEESGEGPLPVIAADGRQPWQVYARPFAQSGRRPRVAIVISGLGLSTLETLKALSELPPEVTLSFLPAAGNTARWLSQARRKGHETLLDLSLEPVDDPRQYVGPHTLFASLEPRQNLERLDWVMSRGTGYIGLATYMGEHFARSPEELRPILGELKKRGLAFFDARTTGVGPAMALASELDLPHAGALRVLDAEVSTRAVFAVLASLERLAKTHGSAIGIGSAYPETITAVTRWAKRPKGVALAPLSALLRR